MEMRSLLANSIQFGVVKPTCIIGLSFVCAASAVDGVAHAVGRLANSVFQLCTLRAATAKANFNRSMQHLRIAAWSTVGVIPGLGVLVSGKLFKDEGDSALMSGYHMRSAAMIPPLIVCSAFDRFARAIQPAPALVIEI